MKALYYIKTTLKGMFSSMFVVAANFIIFPILLACFMGFITDSAETNPLKLKSVSISIVDEDNSEMSQMLKDMLESEELSDFIKIQDEDPDFELKIEKGYENNVLSLEEGNITLNKNINNRSFSAQTLKSILDNYHKNLYVALSREDAENLNTILNSEIIDNITIDKIESKNAYEEMATSLIGFVIGYLMLALIQSSYADPSVNLDKRMSSLPITKMQALVYDTLAAFVYVFIIISLYVMFFRITDLGFRGNLVSLLILIMISSILVTSVSKTISTILGGKYGKILGSIVFLLPMLSGEVFGFGVEKLKYISPTNYLNNAFKLYNINGNLEGCSKWLIMIIVISAVVYCAAIVKTCLDGRMKNAINKINTNKYKKTA